jgi:hypothetical protein
MSESTPPPAGTLFLAVSIRSGDISRSERGAGGDWSKFAPVYAAAGPGERAAQVSALFEKAGATELPVPVVGFTTTAVPPELFFTVQDGKGAWQPKTLLAAGMAPADLSLVQRGTDTFEVRAVGIGAPTLDRWLSGLPTQELKDVLPLGRQLGPGGDLLATADTGKMNPADVIVDLSTAWPEVCLVTETGGLFFDPDASTRNGFEDVKAQAGKLPRRVVSASCSGPHVVALTDDGVIYHTIRGNNGTYTKFEDVNAATKVRFAFTQAATASFNGGADLHLAAITADGDVYYTQWHRGVDRHYWLPFEDVKVKAGNDPGAATSVAVTA